jgi:hypothetical protein
VSFKYIIYNGICSDILHPCDDSEVANVGINREGHLVTIFRIDFPDASLPFAPIVDGACRFDVSSDFLNLGEPFYTILTLHLNIEVS